MIKSKSFYVLYPHEDRIRLFLNSLKLLCDFSQRTEAHITVRGPYKIKLSTDIINNLNIVIKNEILYISSVDNFFPFSNQNTVFFKCEENDNLKKIWNKLTYNDFKPHITMYDGKDSSYAVEIFNILSRNFKPFKYEVEALSYLEPKSKDSLGLFTLSNNFDFSFFQENIETNIDSDTIRDIKKSDRLSLIDSLSKKMFNEFSTFYYR